MERAARRLALEVEALMAYAADVAGGRMNTAYVSLRPEMTVAQALAYLRLQAADRIQMVYYAYVMDTGDHLLGVISFRDVAKAVLEEQDFENKMLKGYIKNWPA